MLLAAGALREVSSSVVLPAARAVGPVVCISGDHIPVGPVGDPKVAGRVDILVAT